MYTLCGLRTLHVLLPEPKTPVRRSVPILCDEGSFFPGARFRLPLPSGFDCSLGSRLPEFKMPSGEIGDRKSMPSLNCGG